MGDDFSRKVLVNTTLSVITANFEYLKQVKTDDFYYPPDLITFHAGEVMVELGSNNGETLQDFIDRCPNFKSAYCFEPDQVSIKLLANLVTPYENRIKIIPKAAWNKRGTIGFVPMDGAMNSKVDITELNSLVETTVVDEEVQEPITYMKMDVEGAELMALEGAKEQIVQNKPKLAVSVYHKKEDILEIPQYILSLRPDYRLYLRHHGWDGCDTVLYAL